MTPKNYLDFNRKLYGLGKGDLDYLDISPETDDLQLKINETRISFDSVIHYLKKQNLSSAIVRVPQLIDKQLYKLYGAFSKAFANYNYPSVYQGVFPVKVNHNSDVLKSISTFGEKHGHGWEVGTKPELLIALSLTQEPDSTLIICNGSKDSDYIESALILTELGYNLIINIESKRELELLIYLSKKKRITPQIGLRLKMNQKVEGHWGHSSGLYSKFGLSSSHLNTVVAILKSNDLLNSVKLLHGHLGSQINNVKYFQRSVIELMGYYQYLYDNGATDLRTLNFGGGLGIDYEGNGEESGSGISYSFENYAEMIISTVFSYLKNKPEIVPPNIITESGRAITATSSMMLIEILEKRKILPASNDNFNFNSEDIFSLKKKYGVFIRKTKSLTKLNEFLTQFSSDIVNIQNNLAFWSNLNNQRELEILISSIRSSIIKKACFLLKKNSNLLKKNFIHKFKALFELMSIYSIDLVANFSVFRGACDIVLANQYFPIIPTSGLKSKPKTLTRIVDITCDSDGEITKFVTKSRQNFDENFSKDGHFINFPQESIVLQGIPFPEKNIKQGKYILIALTGAYQDTVQFDQNLLGALPEIEITLDKANKLFSVSVINQAESNISLIKQMNFSIEDLIRNIPKTVIDLLLHSNPYVSNPKMKIVNDLDNKIEANQKLAKRSSAKLESQSNAF